MGQKVHPYGFRLGYIKGWNSNWYADKTTYAKTLSEDLAIRKYIEKHMKNASVASVDIARTSD
ncbi:MAG: 30S ribosomal protein S3, partial [Halobacteriovoraceae bacterium]|nr:30S ribosomal protein S3 [Halobacteriovoraceae bacterium]